MGWFSSKEEKLAGFRALERDLVARLEVIRKEIEGGASGPVKSRNQALRIRTEGQLSKVRKKIRRLEAKLSKG